MNIVRILLILLATTTAAHADWFAIWRPTGGRAQLDETNAYSAIQCDILVDVTTHCDEQGRKTAYEPDKVTYCHEATHMVNSRIRQAMRPGWAGFYLGSHCIAYLPIPNITLTQAAKYVHSSLQNSTYQLYFVEQRRYWNDNALYVFDEWSAYINGSQAAVELRVDNHGEFDRAVWFCHYADCVLVAIKQHDPHYSAFKDLEAFINFQKQRTLKYATPKERNEYQLLRARWLASPQTTQH